MASSLVRLLVSLAHLEGAWVVLRPLDLKYPLLRQDALIQVAARHYMSAALGELLNVVGSLDIFGDVARLLQGWGLGVWHLISMPAKGAMRGGVTKFATGLLYGFGSMVQTTTYATTNSIAKTSRRTRAALMALVPETVRQAMEGGTGPAGSLSAGGGGGGGGGGQQVARYGGAAGVPSYRRPPGAGSGGGAQKDLLLSAWEGYAGILQRVGLKASRLDLLGAAKELAMGGLGAVALPSMVVLRLAEAAATSIRAVVAPHGRSGGLYGPLRPRVPRYVNPGAPLQPYRWLESYCRLLQKDVWGGAFAHEELLGGVQVSEAALALVTARHLVVVQPRQPNDSRAAEVALVVPTEGLVLSQREGLRTVLVAHVFVDQEQTLGHLRGGGMAASAAPAVGGSANASSSSGAVGGAGQQQQQQQPAAAAAGLGEALGGGGGHAHPNYTHAPRRYYGAGGGDDEEGDEEAAAEAAARLQPPPWLCVTQVEVGRAEDAVRLVELLEGVRGSYERRRRASACRMIGF